MRETMSYEKHYHLMIPGPTEVSPEALLAMAQPTIPHYGADWVKLNERVIGKLRKVFQTENDMLILPGSASAAMEAAVMAVVEPGDKVLVELSGFLCYRFKEIVEKCGGVVVPLEFEWGRAVDPEWVERALRDHPDVRVMTFIHNETSTGITSPAEAVGEICRKRDVVLICDTVSSMGGTEVQTDAWNLDLCMTGNQKCLESPPGVGILSISPKVWDRIKARKQPVRGWLLNLENVREYSEKWGAWHPQGPVTAATAIYAAMDVSLDRILEEGLAHRFQRHALNAKAFREGLKTMGVEMLADEMFASNTVTAFCIPEGITAEAIQDTLKTDFDILVSGGHAHLTGKILRVGHMAQGAHPRHIIPTLAGIGYALKRGGVAADVGAGLESAMQVYADDRPQTSHETGSSRIEDV